MNLTSNLFEAYLKCSTKCFLRSRGEAGAGNEYADWVRVQTELYRNDRVKDLKSIAASDGRSITAPLAKDTKMTEREYAFDFVARAANLESHIHFIERTPPKDPDKPTQFVPTRFIYTNKINRDDKLLLAFDARVLSEVIGHEVSLGRIIHGDDPTTLKVKTSELAKELRQLTGKITSLLSNNSPPDLVLNRHCAECEFKARCRNKAIEADDLSLLSAMTEKERSRHRSKGIFTVNQLSYTFRPRKAPKRAKNPAKLHYLALQALSLRENTVYVHGNPQLPMSDCKIFLDIEGLPDSEFYYLIGVLLVINGQESFHSFWAEEKSDEPNIFAQFAEAICQLPDFRVLHYGAYETVALRRMKARMPECLRPKIDTILERATNVMSVVRPHIYFPTYSNGLKDIGRFIGYQRTHESATGLLSIVWRKGWEVNATPHLKDSFLQYNEDDCRTLKHLSELIGRLTCPVPIDPGSPHSSRAHSNRGYAEGTIALGDV